MFFCSCSDFGMTGADLKCGSCKYLLNQQTLNKYDGGDWIMYVECWSGLASRIITLSQAYYLQKRYGKGRLKIVWPIAEDCRISFYEVFDKSIFNDIDWELIEYKHKKKDTQRFREKYEKMGGIKKCLYTRKLIDAIRCFILITIVYWGEKLDFSVKNKYRKKGMYFDTTEMYGSKGTFGAMAHETWRYIKKQLICENDDIYIRAFKYIINGEDINYDITCIRFQKEYYHKVNDILQGRNDVIGVQIRRTDHVDSINNSLSIKFEKRIAQILEEDKDILFFISTDDIIEEQHFISIYGSSILVQKDKTWNRSSIEGMRAAVVDFLCLANCQYILGSYNSTFGEIAAKYGGIDEIII